MDLHGGPAEGRRDDRHDQGTELEQERRRSRSGSVFVGVTIGVVTLLVMLVFLIQNDRSQRIELLWWEANVRTGLALLLAAGLGALLVAAIAAARMVELRRIARHPQERPHRTSG